MKRVSLESAYSFALRTVFTHMGFLLVSLVLGVAVTALSLMLLGVLDAEVAQLPMTVMDRFAGLTEALNNTMHNALGVLQYGKYSVEQYMASHLPPALASHFVQDADLARIDVSNVDVVEFAKVWLLPALAFKMAADVIAMGWYKLGLNTLDKKAVSWELLYNQYRHLPYYVAVNLVVLVATLVGCLLFVLPGVYVYQRLRFAKLFVIDQEMGIMQALEASWKATEGQLLELLAFSLVAAVVRSLTAVVFVLAFVVHPLHHEAEVAVYRQLAK